jgi:CRP/FNR family transcriptional regulator, cyclic AMP receptor protein
MSPAAQSLSSVPLFANVPPETLARLEASAVSRQFAPGTEILNEGEAGIGFYLIDEGAASVTRAGSDRVLRTLRAGDYFGEMALFDGHRRSATVRAVEPTRCRVLSRWDFLAEVRSNPELAIHLLETLSRYVREADEQPAQAQV